jgi:hypothetical protein
VTATDATVSVVHPEPYESFAVGDRVWCLAWLGMPFVVVGKDDDAQRVEIDGTGPCSLPEGAKLDLHAESLYMLTHQQWDAIWYWPDVANETYQQVVDRFVDAHHEGELVVGYPAGGFTVTEDPKRGITYRLSFTDYQPFGQIKATPVAAITEDGTSLTLAYDPSIAEEKWLRSGPTQALELKMVAYRWSLCHGKIVLNWHDFD